TRVLQELLEQPAQFERRALAAVRHHGCCNVARAIDLPIANRHAAQSCIALPSALAALALLAGDPTLPLARPQLPAGTRAGTRRILERDEAGPTHEGLFVRVPHATLQMFERTCADSGAKRTWPQRRRGLSFCESNVRPV